MTTKIHQPSPPSARFQQPDRRWLRLALLLGAILFLAWAWLAGTPAVSGPIVADDINQHRINAALPPPRGNALIRQSFTPRWDGLREIELTLVRYDDPAQDGRFRMQLLDDTGAAVATRELDTRSFANNHVYLFRFPPQRHSAGRRYTLQLSGSEDNPLSAWGYTLDVYDEGDLTLTNGALAKEGGGESFSSTARELRFVTRYQLTWTDAAAALCTMLYRDGLLLLLALLLILMPGCLILLAGNGRWPRWDAAAWWGAAVALGVSVWPVVWFWVSLAGGRWAGWSLWLCLGVGWAAVLFLWLRRQRPVTRPLNWRHASLLLLLLLALAVRLLAVRDLLFPAWVDSSRHALITAVMADSGRFPDNYQPFFTVDRTPYHYGFHTLSASLRMMTGWPLNRLLLYLTQLLGSLVPLTTYAAVWLFTRRRGAGLTAAFLVALPFFFPAYYATWGRMTQLTAMLLMPVLLALTWLLARGGRRWRQTWWLVGLLTAGLFFIHFRVFLYFLPFAAISWAVTWAIAWPTTPARHVRWLAAAVGLSFLLAAPRFFQLAAMTDPTVALSATIPNYNTFPTSYVKVGWERPFLLLAAVGLMLTLFAGLVRKRWTALPLVLAGWVATLFLALAGDRIGLPETALVNLNSMYITLFLPLAIFLGIMADQGWHWLRKQRENSQFAGRLFAGAALAAMLLFGVRQQIGILNPDTILARRADLAGLAWVEESLPSSALVAVNSWLWLGQTWAGGDGGAWLTPLTGVAATTPPIDHVYSRELFQFVQAFNQTAIATEDWSRPEAAAWLREQGVTHIFVGERGGFFDPAALAGNPKLRLLYGRNGTFIFAVNP
ncbi:MAG: hypothetical protein ACE5E7_07935 [Anaerolineae bacterium]